MNDIHNSSDERRGGGIVMKSRLSLATQVKKFLESLYLQDKTVFSHSELKEIAENAGFQHNLNNIIDHLNIQSHIMKIGQNMYKLLN